MSHTFAAAPLDRTSTVISWLLTTTLIGVAATMVALQPLVIGVPGVVFAVVVLWLSWALSPRAYRLEGHDLVVVRRGWKPFRATIEGVAAVEEPWRMGLRVGGSGGGFGYYGRFRRSDVGRYRAYLTSRHPERVLAVQTDVGLVTLSPEDPAAFRDALQALTTG